MNDNKLTIRKELAVKAAEIDACANEAMAIFEGAESLAAEIGVAQSVRDMRELLTEEVMRPIMALMGTSIGFKTDRRYEIDVVRDCFIESRLRGFHLVGNEWNIIAGNFYACQAGLKRKVRQLSGGTFQASFDAPEWKPGHATIKCRATWSLNGADFAIGIADTDPCVFSVNVHDKTGPDAVRGKAERKLLKAVFERMTGRSVPEGDIEETLAPAHHVEPVKLNFGVDAERIQSAPGLASAPAETVAARVPASAEPPLQAAEKQAVKFLATITGGARSHIVDDLQNFMEYSKVSFEDFRTWVKATGRAKDSDSWPSWEFVPESLAIELRDKPKERAKCVTLYSKAARKPVETKPQSAEGEDDLPM